MNRWLGTPLTGRAWHGSDVSIGMVGDVLKAEIDGVNTFACIFIFIFIPSVYCISVLLEILMRVGSCAVGDIASAFMSPSIPVGSSPPVVTHTHTPNAPSHRSRPAITDRR